MSILKTILIVSLKALRILLLEGPLKLWQKTKYYLGNSEYFIDLSREKERKLYHTLSEYLIHSTILPVIRTPYSEQDLYIKKCMDSLKNSKTAKYLNYPQDTKISIIMPTYNRSSLIIRAIDSVINQTYKNWELIIVDDGSCDDTEGVMKNYLNDPRIIYIKHAINQGPAFSRNRALERSIGEYICYLDSDNILDVDFIMILANELRTNPSYISVYCAQALFEMNQNNNIERGIRFGPFNRALIENKNYVDIGAIMHTRAVIERYGVFNENMRCLEDWEFLLRFTSELNPKAIPCVLSYYYNSVKNNQVTYNLAFSDGEKHVDSLLKSKPLNNELQNQNDRSVSELYSVITYPRHVKTNPVSIIIPSYECLNYLKLCINSVMTFTEKGKFELIIVDNESGADVQYYLSEIESIPDIQVIRNGTNMGYTYAVNLGLRKAKNTTDVILLNNDTVVTSGWVEGLTEVFDLIPDAAMAIPRQSFIPYTKTLKTHSPEAYEHREADVNISFHHKNLINPLLYEKFGLMELNFAPFFCVYIPRRTINMVAQLDLQNGPHYDSDRLYCDVVRHVTGNKIVYTPHSKVYHLLQKSTEMLRHKDAKTYQRLFVDNTFE